MIARPMAAYHNAIATGSSPWGGLRDALVLAAGDATGVSWLMEGVWGVDISTGKALSGVKRVCRVAQGSAQLYLTAHGANRTFGVSGKIGSRLRGRKLLADMPEVKRPAVDKSWQDLIEGKAHASDPHKIRTYREAIGMAKSGQYDKIRLDKALRTTTGGQTPSLLRPDIAGVRKGSGVIDIVEVVSPSQEFWQMELKVNEINTLLGELAGTGRVVTIK